MSTNPEGFPDLFSQQFALLRESLEPTPQLARLPEIKFIAETLGLPEVINAGAERIVFVDPRDSEKVIAVELNSRNSIEAEEIYLSQKILFLLFPKHFPQIFESYGQDPDDKPHLTGTIRQRLQTHGPSFQYRNQHEIDHPLSEIDDFIYIFWGAFPLDLAWKNKQIVIKDGESYEYYMDTVDLEEPREVSDETVLALRAYMEKENIPNRIRQEVMNAARKLHTLHHTQSRRLLTS